MRPRKQAAVVVAIALGLLVSGLIAGAPRGAAITCITGPQGPDVVQPNLKCIVISYQTAWTATDAQYSHNSNADIHAYSSGSWGMTTKVWGEVDGNRMEGSSDYTHTWVSGYEALGQTTVFEIGLRYRLWQDYYSGSYVISPYQDLMSINFDNKGNWDWKAMPQPGALNTQTVTVSPGLPPWSSSFGFKAETSSTIMLQAGLKVGVFGHTLDVGISWAHHDGYQNSVIINFNNPGTTAMTFIIYWEYLQQNGGNPYAFMAHVWRYA